MPTFTAPLDCTPWVTGGLWPAEFASADAETATLAEYLKVDLQRIAGTANDDLRALARVGMDYPVRREAEARVIDEARAKAVRRVESTLRQLRPHAPATRSADMDKTQVIPAVRDEPPPAPPPPAEPPPPASGADDVPVKPNDDEPLQRLLEFVARQEPRLSWAVGERPDGTTVLVTDLAHGWIPPGIALPDGVQLLDPQRRSGRVQDLLGATTRTATYAPGDAAKWSTDAPSTEASVTPRDLPQLEDLDWELRVATHWREGLPRLVSALTKAIAAGGDVVEQEADLLRVHLDTARYQILAEYPDVDPAQLLNCMLLAATESRIAGDQTSANYHFAWFLKLENRPDGKHG